MSETVIDALRRGDTQAALEAARAAVAAAPDSADAQHELGLALRVSGDAAGARAAFDQAIALDPGKAVFHLSRAGVALGQGDAGAAGADLDQAVALDPNQREAYLAQSQLALATSDFTTAEERLNRALRIDPEHPATLVSLGNLRLAQGELDAAIKAYTHAVERAPRDPVAQSCLGIAYLRKGVPAFAEQALRNALELNPGMDASRRALVDVLAGQRRHDEAIAALAPLLERRPDDLAALRVLGGLQVQAGRPAEAVAVFERAVAAAPEDLRAIQGLAAARAAAGEPEAAQAFLDGKLAAMPQAEALWRTRLAMEPGRDGRVAIIERWHGACPDSSAAAEARAQVLEARGEFDAAEQMADLALAAPPQQVLGAVLVKARAEMRREPERALERLAPLADAARDPGLRRGLLGWMGHAADRAGRHAEALSRWSGAQALSEGAALPQLGHVDERIAEAVSRVAAPADADFAPMLLLGAPGSGVERLAGLLRGQTRYPLLDDRFGRQPRRDRLVESEFSRYLAADPEAIADFGASWRQGLAGFGLDHGQAIDWLMRFDARLLPAMAGAAPGTRFIVAMRDPRDTLLNWLAFGAPQRWPIHDVQKAADWLALSLAHLWQLTQFPQFGLAVIAQEAMEESPDQVLGQLAQFLGLDEPLDPAGLARSLAGPSGWPTALPSGRWRDYREVLEAPFAALKPVIRAFGYPED